MAIDVHLPQWGMGMQEGTILEWLKHEGDQVTAGEDLVEVEAPKDVVTMESPATGVLLKILAQPGDVVPVRGVIAVLGDPGESA